MIDFNDILYPSTVIARVPVDSKKAFYAYAGQVAAQALGLDAGEVADRLLERERLGSTAFGRGVALPHARIEGLAGVRGIVLRFEKPIDFDAIDGLPVDVAFVLLSPLDGGADHLKALALASRFLRDDETVERLRGATSSDALYALLIEGAALDAA